jgi:hypothetical protein
MKQSSIEWLMEIDKSRAITIEEWQQAREMEKVQMIDFAYECRNVMAADEFAITHWYDKTFNTNEK